MATSATITSGRSLSAASIIARPSSTIPTSSNSSERSALTPSAIMRWSSASNTRGRIHCGSPRFIGARATMLVPSPGALSMWSSPSTSERRCLIPASPRLGRLCFRPGSNPAPSSRTASSRSPPTTRSSTSTDLAPEWRATLRSASCATLYRQRDRARVASSTSLVALKVVRNPFDGVEPRALRPERLDQSKVFEDGGMQRVGKRMHVLAELDQVVTYRTHRLASDRIAQSLLLVSRINRKQSEPLGDVVVQRARQPGSFILVSGDQASV